MPCVQVQAGQKLKECLELQEGYSSLDQPEVADTLHELALVLQVRCA